MKKFLKIHKSLTLNQKLENINRPITSKETESLKKKFPTKDSPGTDGKFYQTLKEFNQENADLIYWNL